jgi:hypothetical protein
MKPPAGIAMLPDGSSLSGYILKRHDGTIWGFASHLFQSVAMPPMTVLYETSDMFVCLPDYARCLAKAEEGAPNWHLLRAGLDRASNVTRAAPEKPATGLMAELRTDWRVPKWSDLDKT